MYNCFNCSSELIWQNDFMKSELDGFEYDEDDDRIVNCLYCPNCHSDVFCVHPSTNMEKEYEEENKKESTSD